LDLRCFFRATRRETVMKTEENGRKIFWLGFRSMLRVQGAEFRILATDRALAARAAF
jgi:hypothetical protein